MSATIMHRPRYQGPGRAQSLVGWAVVIAIHLLVLWALVTGTARRGLESIKKKPLEAAVIQEVIIPPPPPPPPPPAKQIPKPEPKVIKPKAPPPPFVPRPEVQPPVSPSAVAVPSVPTPPIAPPVFAPPVIAPPAAEPPVVALPAPPKPSRSRAEMAIACPTQVRPEMPKKALRDGTEGVVKAQALIRDGSVREVTILSGPRVFHAAVQEAMLQYKCASTSDDVLATQEFVFKIE